MESDIAKLNNDIALAQNDYSYSKRADLTTQLANVSMAAEKKDREQRIAGHHSSSSIGHDTERSLGKAFKSHPCHRCLHRCHQPETAKVGFDQWNEWNTTKTLPVAANYRNNNSNNFR